MPERITDTTLAEWKASAERNAYFTLRGETMLEVIAEVRRLRARLDDIEETRRLKQSYAVEDQW